MRSRPQAFREALMGVPAAERDAWVDEVLGIDGVAEDGALPGGCVPYLPCAVELLVRMVEEAGVGVDDVFVDIGAGVGRAAAVVHLLTGAPAIGIEIQPALVAAARAMPGVRMIEGDALAVIAEVARGTVFFLYCPFGGARLAQVLGNLEEIARAHPIRVCTVDLPPLAHPWLVPVSTAGALAVYRSA